MSAKLFGKSTSHSARDPAEVLKRQEQQVSALYELGLLGSSRGPGRREKNKDRAAAGGSSVPERYPNKSKSVPRPCNLLLPWIMSPVFRN
jgi:hypothetical protein